MNSLIELVQANSAGSAMITGILISIVCAILGVFITLKKEALLSDGLAHASLSGVAIAIVLSIQPFYIALATGVIMAIGIVYLKRNSNISSDTIIGILFTVLFAGGLLILSLSGEFQLELETYLFGSVLSITLNDILFAAAALIITALSIGLNYKKLIYIILDPEGAFIRGIKVERLEYLIGILTAVAIIISIKLVGVLLVTALLLIPAANAKLLSRKFSHMMPISIAHNVIVVVLGLLLAQNTPPGATIVLISGGLIAITFLLQKIKIIPS